jgi:hypothetical protein
LGQQVPQHDVPCSKITKNMNSLFFQKGDVCCNYGTDGKKTSGFDCLMIPGAVKATTNSIAVAVTQCGGLGGLVTATGTASVTICCKICIKIN